MTTVLHRNLGDQFLDSDGVPLNGYKLYYYQSNTTNLQDTYSEQTGITANLNPITLNSSGRLPVPVFLGSTYDYTETLTDANGVVVSPWPFNGIPKAVAASNPITGFERLYQPWYLVNTSNSPLTLGAATSGNAYECDASGGALTINLPSAAAVTSGTGYVFKKTDGTANAVAVVPSGSDTIDGLNSTMYLAMKNVCVGIISDGAQWLASLFAAYPHMLAGQSQAVSASSSTLNIDLSRGWHVRLALGATVTTFTVSNHPAAGIICRLTIDITSSGAYNITDWPGTTTWPGGYAPTITSGAGNLDTIILTSADGGTNFRGFVAGQDFS